MKKVTETELLKALDELEQATLNKSDDADDASNEASMSKSSKNVPAQMQDQDAVNGGFSDEGDSSEMDAGSAVEGEGVAKSLIDDNEVVQEGFEVSEFLKSFADDIVAATDASIEHISKGLQEQREFNTNLQKAVIAMGNMINKLHDTLVAQGDQPAHAPKTVLSKSEVVERDFGGGAQNMAYTKAQVTNALTDMAMKGECDTVAVSAFETTEYMPEGLANAVEQRLHAMYGKK